VISRTTASFRRALSKLPSEARRHARRAYRQFKEDPSHPSLRFKSIHAKEPIYSVRVGMHYRAIGVLSDDEIVWFWIGTHAEYDRVIARRRRRKP
jgi:mRNA-degrading endonuclease RelE of RelBE toxin-antitoxin system